MAQTRKTSRWVVPFWRLDRYPTSMLLEGLGLTGQPENSMYGAIVMFALAGLQRDLRNFNNRVQNLSYLSPEDLKYQIDYASRRWTEKTAELKAKLIHENPSATQVDFNVVMDAEWKQLNDHDQSLLSANAYYESVELLQQPQKHLHITNYQSEPPQQALSRTLPLLLSAALVAEEGVKTVKSLYGVYDRSTLSLLLTSLWSHLKNNEIHFPLSFVVESSNNFSAFLFEPTVKKWQFYDARYVGIKELGTAELAGQLALCHAQNNNVIVAAHIMVTGIHVEHADDVLASWVQTQCYRELHTFDQKHAQALDDCHASLLYLACKNGHHQLVAQLLLLGADPNLRHDFFGLSPLYMAVQYGFTHSVAAILPYCRAEDINRLYVGSNTLLHVSVYAGQFDVFSMLLAAGADPSLVNESGMTVLDIAKSKMDQRILNALVPPVEEEEWILPAQKAKRARQQSAKYRMFNGESNDPDYVYNSTKLKKYSK